MRIMARIGLAVLREIDKNVKRVVPCMHSVGAPLAPGQQDVPWPCNPEKYIVHFPETREIWSYGSGYGGNALLGKKCFGLRIASNIARDEGWMAEHMLILGVEDPQGEKTYISAAFPSACGKTNLAMLIPPDGDEGLEGVDGRRRHRLDQARRQRTAARDQPRSRRVRRGAGHVARRPTRTRWRPMARNTIFTNVALTPEGGVWWEGMTAAAAGGVPRLARRALDAGDRPEHRRKPAAHPERPLHRAGGAVPDHRLRTGRVPTACRSAPSSSAAAARPRMPLVYQAFNWSSGVYIGATMGSETTAAATGSVGAGPARSRWRCCRSAAITWATTSGTGSRCSALLTETPKIFHVNWFRKDADGRFLWPGYRENMRVLKWIVDRVHGRVPTRESPIGWMPRYEDIDWRGLDMSHEQFDELQRVDPAQWRREVIQHEELFIDLHDHLPPEMIYERELLICRL